MVYEDLSCFCAEMLDFVLCQLDRLPRSITAHCKVFDVSESSFTLFRCQGEAWQRWLRSTAGHRPAEGGVGWRDSGLDKTAVPSQTADDRFPPKRISNLRREYTYGVLGTLQSPPFQPSNHPQRRPARARESHADRPTHATPLPNAHRNQPRGNPQIFPSFS